jgi:hypothetical protein
VLNAYKGRWASVYWHGDEGKLHVEMSSFNGVVSDVRTAGSRARETGIGIGRRPSLDSMPGGP